MPLVCRKENVGLNLTFGMVIRLLYLNPCPQNGIVNSYYKMIFKDGKLVCADGGGWIIFKQIPHLYPDLKLFDQAHNC